MIENALKGMPLPKTWIKAYEDLFAHRLTLYICVVLVASIGAWGYGIRTRTIFACQAGGYSADRYVAYCNGASYGDYEQGAFQFNLEAPVQESIRNADVLFLGNSRLEVAFSTVATERWISANSGRYYLMGFDYGNALFEGELLSRIHPRAAVYVIDVDDFFELSESPVVKKILHDPNARNEYEAKRFWQRIHEPICGAFTALCGHRFAIFRSRDTGAYYKGGWGLGGGRATPVSYESAVDDQNVAEARIATAVDFLSRFTQNSCVVLTMVPTARTQIGTAKAIASGVGLQLVTPEILGELRTSDGSHLDQPSAQRWAQAFFQIAGPQIRSCLDKRNAAAR
jgi:hypothetical protein